MQAIRTDDKDPSEVGWWDRIGFSANLDRDLLPLLRIQRVRRDQQGHEQQELIETLQIPHETTLLLWTLRVRKVLIDLLAHSFSYGRTQQLQPVSEPPVAIFLICSLEDVRQTLYGGHN